MRVEPATEGVFLDWLHEGRQFAAATVVEVLGSAPLDVGATMLIDAEGRIEGSVTGGCVEGAVAEEAQRILNGYAAGVLRTYGISDQLAGEVGLMCGGTVRIMLSEIRAEATAAVSAALGAAREDRPAALATLLEGAQAGSRLAVVDGESIGSLGGTKLLDRSVTRDSAGLLARGVSMIRRYGADGATLGDEVPVFIHSFSTRPRMVIFGAIDFSAALAQIARSVGYHVTICDARPAFLAAARFQVADELVSDWPAPVLDRIELGPRDAVLVFSHDPKFDEPALICALRTEVGYIGALGSRQTADDRRDRLRLAGVKDTSLERILSPCGLDVGAATPAETAVSVLAEIISRRAGRRGEPLIETTGSIRHRARLDLAL